MTFEPIGVFHGGAAYKYEAPRQGVFAGGAGHVELAPGWNFETALRGLEGFERIWLVFVFDRNAGAWRPTTARLPRARRTVPTRSASPACGLSACGGESSTWRRRICWTARRSST